MPKPDVKTNRNLRFQQVQNMFVGIIRPRLPLDLKNTCIKSIKEDDTIAVLGNTRANPVIMDAARHEL